MGTKGTANHVYFLDEKLGSGSSANVYVGRNKKSGQLCAVKVYSEWGADQMREFQTMSMLSHDNIIRFIAVEEESISKGNTLIMELGTGGSVLSMLEKPENAFGFPEDEFLIFLKDTTSALKYLRENKIVHRDIKPGNILRFVGDDLSSQYKITDFGAARELDDCDQFVSIYGTEEYLEPMAYGQALLARKDRGKGGFSASVDLWSLGVTLYHVATGQLPFRAFGGRKNKEDMFNITSKKPSGVISGIQQTLDGPIEWSEELPETCLFSRSLKQRLTKILRRLLESRVELRWTFSDFFKSSVEVTSRRAVPVVLVNEFLITRLYASPSADLQSPSDFAGFLKSELKPSSSWSSFSDINFFHPYLTLKEILELLSHRNLPPENVFVFPQVFSEQDWERLPSKLSLKAPEPSPSRNPSMAEDFHFVNRSLAFVSFLEKACDRSIQLLDLLNMFFHSIWNELVREAAISKALGSEEISTEVIQSNPNKGCKALQNGSSPHSPYRKSHECLRIHFDPRVLIDREWESVAQQGERGMFVWRLIKHKEFYRRKLILLSEKVTSQEKNKFVRMMEDLSEIARKFRTQAELERRDHGTLTHNELQIHRFDRKRVIKLISGAEKLHASISSYVVAYCHTFKEFFRLYDDKKKFLRLLSSQSAKNSMADGLQAVVTTNSDSSDFAIDALKAEVLQKLDAGQIQREKIQDLIFISRMKDEESRSLMNDFSWGV